MSSQHTLCDGAASVAASGEVEHIQLFSIDIGCLCESSDYSDIVLVADNVKFFAHKVILAARSEYFRALLFGGLRESLPGCSEIILKDTNAEAFSILLKYTYTGCLKLSTIKEEIVLELLGLAHQYAFGELEKAISEYLKATLNIRNVCMIYDISTLYFLDALAQKALRFMDSFARDVMSSDSFFNLSQSALQAIISRDSFAAPEVEIFNALCQWCERNPDVSPQSVMEAVRLPLMDIEELLNKVRPTGFVDADRILDAIKLRTECSSMKLNYRGHLVADKNVAAAPQAQVIRGEIKAALLDGDCTTYDMDRGFTRHPIDDSNDGIVVKLDQAYIINHIKLLLWDKDQRSYSYYIEVSMDDSDWVKIVDHRQYLCRSWQTLFFPPIVSQYIRLVGTQNTQNRVFHAVCLKAFYSFDQPLMESGLIVPSTNIAASRASSTVIEGVSRSRNALINGDYKSYDWDSGYTCHQLGSGAIVVQFPQPYLVESMRLLLWDCDERNYSFFIEVSIDNVNWQKVIDRRADNCQSWQIITFTRRPVTFVRIVGTRNSANEVFHCVHFECPCQPKPLSEYIKKNARIRMTDDDDCSPKNQILSGDSSSPAPALQTQQDEVSSSGDAATDATIVDVVTATAAAAATAQTASPPTNLSQSSHHCDSPSSTDTSTRSQQHQSSDCMVAMATEQTASGDMVEWAQHTGSNKQTVKEHKQQQQHKTLQPSTESSHDIAEEAAQLLSFDVDVQLQDDMHFVLNSLDCPSISSTAHVAAAEPAMESSHDVTLGAGGAAAACATYETGHDNTSTSANNFGETRCQQDQICLDSEGALSSHGLIRNGPFNSHGCSDPVCDHTPTLCAGPFQQDLQSSSTRCSGETDCQSRTETCGRSLKEEDRSLNDGHGRACVSTDSHLTISGGASLPTAPDISTEDGAAIDDIEIGLECESKSITTE